MRPRSGQKECEVISTIIGAIIFLVVMVIGGASSLTGPIVGAIVYYRLNDYTLGIENKSYLSFSRDFLKDRPGLATIVFAVLLIGLMFAAFIAACFQVMTKLRS